MIEKYSPQNNILKFMFVLFLTSFSLFITYYTKKVDLFVLFTTTIVVLSMHILMYYIMKKTDKRYLLNVQYVILFYNLFFVPFFYSSRNIGNTILYIMPLLFIGIILIINHKTEWIIIPISIISTIINKDFYLMYFNIFFYLFLYKAFSNRKINNHKYTILSFVSIILVSTTFFCINFIEKTESTTFTSTELNAYRFYHLIEIPIFCLLMLPYIILGIRFFKNIFSNCKSKNDVLKYAFIPIMSISFVPCFFSELNYGPLFFSITTYYALVILSLCALNDKIVLEELHHLMEDIKKRYKYSSLLLLYIATMIPYYDIHINQVMTNIINWLDTNYLHFL